MLGSLPFTKKRSKRPHTTMWHRGLCIRRSTGAIKPMIKRFHKAQDTEAVRLLWEAALRSGDIPGAYWATLAHWASTPELIKAAFADVHMLSHLVGAANLADIRRLPLRGGES